MKKVFILIIIMLSMMLFNSNVLAYKKYDIGDKITYNGEDYYVIEYSDIDKDYVTLLKANTLTIDEVNKYAGGEYVSVYGGIPYYLDCDSIHASDCVNDYDQSFIKIVIDNWAKDKLSDSDLVEIDGYKVRLITFDELTYNLGYVYQLLYGWKYTEDTPEWVYNSNYYWTMSNYENNSSKNYFVGINLSTVGVYSDNIMVRPVVNLKKCILDDSCLECEGEYKYKTEKVIKYKEYNIGDEVEYNGEKYYVIELNDNTKSYVTLLKAEPLTVEEVNKYVGGEYESKNGEIPYYLGCDSGNSINCTNDYTESLIKIVVDNWASDKLNLDDLVDVNGYKARLITVSELFTYLGYSENIIQTESIYKLTEEVPEWVYNLKYTYWTMTPFGDYENKVYKVLNTGYINGKDDESIVYKGGSVRPVINLDKCTLKGGCWEEDVQIEDGCIGDNVLGTDDSKTTVSVGNTLSAMSNIFLVISIVLIIGGLIIIVYNYVKSKKGLNK